MNKRELEHQIPRREALDDRKTQGWLKSEGLDADTFTDAALPLIQAQRIAHNCLKHYGRFLGPNEAAVLNTFLKALSNQARRRRITQAQIPAGNVYLSPIVDYFDGLVVSWTLGTRPDAGLVNTMLDTAIETVTVSESRPIVHSDRGAHYRWPGWLSRMSSAKLVRSMSRKGCSPDNAACEGFFGRLKTELFYPRDWKGITLEQFIQSVDAYIRWYNEKRIKVSLGSLSPIQYRKSLGLAA